MFKFLLNTSLVHGWENIDKLGGWQSEKAAEIKYI